MITQNKHKKYITIRYMVGICIYSLIILVFQTNHFYLSKIKDRCVKRRTRGIFFFILILSVVIDKTVSMQDPT